ncbi:hypothetical protein FPCIR_8414 [Fusarium pseudocircinatum]|uniref:BTB domain-containing protein n=1 Tax=Fusarium pseudocircinatum TaxID=56676 RepID=A0A8H5L778_9HYPO|nr:hypothetical protein FPCIR_8414 [Fusarium pseudocircinatum]
MDTPAPVAKMDASPPVPDADGGVVTGDDSIITIVPDGDVVLVVGTRKQKIQVSSHFLKHISPVLEAVIDAAMKEGEALAKKCDDDAPVEIVLPKDKAATMAQLLNTLYGSDPGTKGLSIAEVKKLVVLADKYEMIERIEIFSSFWLRNAAKRDNPEVTENDANALTVAYLLNNDQAFYDLTLSMQYGQDSLLKLAKGFHDKYTGLRLRLAIEEVRRASSDERNEHGGKMGLCLFCFSRATESFIRKRADCPSPERHFEWLRQE